MTRLLISLLLTLACAACATPSEDGSTPQPVSVGIIAFNDFHGALEPVAQRTVAAQGRTGTAAAVGGAAWLASALDALRARHAYSVTVSAGDLIGASPLISSLFLDEPTIGAMNRIGLDFNAVGNHEFDRGTAELLRLQQGGCAQHTVRKPCAVEPFAGARFQFLAASTFTPGGKTLLPATGIRRFGTGARQVTLGFIGLTLHDTPRLVSPGGVAGVTFANEAEAINAAVPALVNAGADAVIVLLHQGGRTTQAQDPNGCDGLEGTIVPILARLDPRIDVVVSGHTHEAYVCQLPLPGHVASLLLTSAGSQGRLLTEITLTIDPVHGRVIAAGAVNHPVDAAHYAARPDIAAYVARYGDAAHAVALRPVGRLSGSARRSENGMGGTIGNLIADAQLDATRNAGAQIALTNPFGIRAALEPAADGSVRFGQIYAAQPFANDLVTTTLTGAQLKALLEQGVDGQGPDQWLAPSAGFAYCVDPDRQPGDHIARLRLNEQPIALDRTYRITVNSFLAQGGDGFTVLQQGSDAVVGGLDLEALEAWLKAVPVRQVPAEQRVCAAAR